MSKATEAAAVVETSIAIRTPEVIAAEIRSIDQQARQYVLHSAIDIGRKLHEAKALVAHGEWGEWLRTHVSYSQSTANNFMRVSEEYANSQTLVNLTYSQAVTLLSVPAEEREAFVEEHNATEMSTRELQAAIKAKQDLEKRLQDKEEEALQQKAKFDEWAKKQAEQREALNQQYQRESELRKEQEQRLIELQKAQEETASASEDSKALTKVKADLKKAEKAASDTKKRLAELEANMEEALKKREAEIEMQLSESLKQREKQLAEQMKQLEEESARQIADMQEQLRKNNNTAAIRVKMHFESMIGTFNQLLAAVSELENHGQKQAISERIGKTFDEMKTRL